MAGGQPKPPPAASNKTRHILEVQTIRTNGQNGPPSKLRGIGQGKLSLRQVKDTSKSLREKESGLHRSNTVMGILPLHNIDAFNHHPAHGLPGLDLESEIYSPLRLALGVMETDQKQRGASARRKLFLSTHSKVGLSSMKQWPQEIMNTPIPNDDGAQGSQHRHRGGSRIQAQISLPPL